MEWLPTEIWEQILENLVDFRDCENASKTCPLFTDILHPLKSTCIFGQVLPLIFELLSKSDILQCRLVCKRWTFGVEYFLENNAYHRPANGKLSNSSVFKTDLPVNSLETLFKDKKLDCNYNFSNIPNRENLVSEAAAHSRCPILGRALNISEVSMISDESNLQYLEIFGRHIWFLKIIICMNPVEALKRILNLLSYLPNLKSLRIEGRLMTRSESRDTEQLSKFVENFCKSHKNESLSSLPKLEALRIFLIGNDFYKYWNECLVICLPTENLQSLYLYRIMNLRKLKSENLVDLSLTLNSDADLEKISPNKCTHLRRLSLKMSGRVKSSYLLGVVSFIGENLRNLELNILPPYFSECDDSPENIPAQFGRFSDHEIFKDNMRNVKRVTLKGVPPPSLNFLLGLTRSLEYLHISMEYLYNGWQERYIDPVTTQMKCNEELDILEKLKSFSRNQIPVTYESNVWTLFKRLKVLTVSWNHRDVENRRDIYERYLNKKINLLK